MLGAHKPKEARNAALTAGLLGISLAATTSTFTFFGTHPAAPSITITIITIINHAFAGQLNQFTRLRALLVLHDRGNDR
jgi:hypothetical protein